MQIRLQTLEHQQRALNALTRVFKGVELDVSTPPEANIAFDPADPQIRENINAIQSGVVDGLSLIHISEPTRLRRISYAVFCL